MFFRIWVNDVSGSHRASPYPTQSHPPDVANGSPITLLLVMNGKHGADSQVDRLRWQKSAFTRKADFTEMTKK